MATPKSDARSLRVRVGRLEEEVGRLSALLSALEAERAARLPDKVIVALSHELRTPLTPVLMAASALKAKSPPGPLRDMFEMIERNVSEEARLIERLLAAIARQHPKQTQTTLSSVAAHSPQETPRHAQ